MEELKNKILLDYEINKKCIEEDLPQYIKKMLELWIKYDEELLAIIKKKELQ